MGAFDEVQPYLSSDEHPLWAGQPDPHKIFASTDRFMVPVSLVWTFGIFYCDVSLIRDGAPAFFSLLGVPFALLGIYLVLGRFFVKRRRYQHTAYAVTDQRAIVWAASGSSTTALLGEPADDDWVLRVGVVDQ